MLDEQVGQAVQHVVGPEPPSHHDRQAAPGKLVDDAQHAERAANFRGQTATDKPERRSR